ncbi:MAG TPA: hypothetical protein VF789_13900 [Thermoanaerobaculia bacterium]
MRTLSALFTLVFLALAATLAADGPPWAPLGPGGGHILSLAVNPANPNVLYAGTPDSAYRSVNNGASWVRLAGLAGVKRIVLDPSRPTTVYALTSSQVFKSVNSGATWTSVAPPGLSPSTFLSELAVDPSRPSRLYLSTADQGVWRSDDGGSSWQLAGQGLASSVNVLTVPRTPSGTAFAGTIRNGVYKTTNAGLLWTPVRNGLPAAEQVLALAVSSADPRYVYASLTSGIYRSGNGGASWTRAVAPSGSVVESLTVHPRFPRTLFAVTRDGELFRSRDFGRTWTPIRPPVHVEVFALHAGPGPELLYLGAIPEELDTGGVRFSSDGGARWTTRNRGLTDLRTTAVAAGPGALLAGTLGPGLFRVANPNGPLWSRTHAGFPAPPGGVEVEEITHAGAGYFFATISDGTLWRTADGGATWSRVAALGGPRFEVAGDPDAAGVAWALTSQGFFRTTDGGASWTPLPALPPGVVVRDLQAAPSSPPGARVLYATGAGPRVFRSPDGGLSWVQGGAGLLGDFVNALAVDPLDANVVYAAVWSSTVGGGQFAVWKSVDGGQTWAPTGLRSIVFDLAVSTVPGRLYAATLGQGVLRSDDGGATWREWGTGFPGAEDLAIDPEDPGRVYAATRNGVWVLKEDTP